MQRATVHDICPPLTHGSEDFYDTRNSLAAYLRLGYTFVDNPTVTGFSYSPHSITIKKVSSRNVRRRRDRDIVPGRALWGGDARRDRPTDRQTDGPSICTFVKPAGPRREEEPDGGDLAAVSAVRSSGSFRRQWVYEGSKRERSGRFSSMRALSLTQSHSSLLPPFLEGQTPHRFRCDQRPESARFKFSLLQVSALESASIIVKKDGI